MAPHLHETRRPSTFPDVLKLKSANGPSCRPASGTFHRSVPVMPAARVASHAFAAFVPIPDFDSRWNPDYAHLMETFCG